MKMQEHVASASDRASTREELFEVLQLLGSFEETLEPELAQTGDGLACLEVDDAASPADLLEEVGSREERRLMEMEPFNSLRSRKVERIN
jgi:hypothetical protein